MIVITVFKWIGIVLLAVLGLILVLVGLVLFVPIRYRVRGSFISDVPDGSVRAGWLLGLLLVTADYHRGSGNSGPEVLFRVFGRKVRTLAGGRKDRPEEDTGDSGTASGTKPDTALPEDIPELRPPEDDELPRPETPAAASDHPETHKPREIGSAPERDEKAQAAGGAAREESAEETPGPFDRALTRVREVFLDLKTTLQAVYRMIRKKTDGAGKIYEMFRAEENSAAVTLLKKELVLALHELMPRKGSGMLRLGTGDPWTTGQAMQLAAMLYPLYGGRIEVIPDFDGTVHDMSGDLRGAVRLAVILWAAARIVLSRRLREMYKRARRIAEEEIL